MLIHRPNRRNIPCVISDGCSESVPQSTGRGDKRAGMTARVPGRNISHPHKEEDQNMSVRPRRMLALAAQPWIVCIALTFNPVSKVAAAEALRGQVSSSEEGLMEGVLVSAKKAGSTITITVASDARGVYSFPDYKIGAGRYVLSVRAVGFELDKPGSANVAAGKTTSLDLKLRKAKDLSPQLSNAEWIASVPGDDNQKKFLYGCSTCHTLERVVKSSHNAEAFLKQVMPKMGDYASQAFTLHPQRRLIARTMERGFGPDATRMAEFLSSINLSKVKQWQYPLQTLPRPKGPATRVIITEYDMPRKIIQPHDVILDAEGIVWFSQFGENNLGRMDPKTGKVTEYPFPVHRKELPTGSLDLEVDQSGNLWLSLMNQGGVAKFDKKTGTFATWPIPERMLNEETQQSMVGPQRWEVDGKVWLNDTNTPGLSRLDLATGKMEPWWAPYKDKPKGEPHSVYGIYADRQNNIFFNDFGGENIGRIDARTGEVKLYPTPTRRSRPRRGRMDADDRLWFAEWRADKIAMFDTRTEKFQEWPVPTPWTAPYDVVPDRNGELWSAGMNTDRVLRFDPKTGKSVEYLLPRETNIRRVFVDNRTTPVTFWVGNNHGASIVKVEALE